MSARIAQADFVWMSLLARDEDGRITNEKWFVDGVIPEPGQKVEIVFDGFLEDGSLKLMLKASAPQEN